MSLDELVDHPTSLRLDQPRQARFQTVQARGVLLESLPLTVRSESLNSGVELVELWLDVPSIASIEVALRIRR